MLDISVVVEPNLALFCRPSDSRDLPPLLQTARYPFPLLLAMSHSEEVSTARIQANDARSFDIQGGIRSVLEAMAVEAVAFFGFLPDVDADTHAIRRDAKAESAIRRRSLVDPEGLLPPGCTVRPESRSCRRVQSHPSDPSKEVEKSVCINEDEVSLVRCERQ